jgi:superfamily II DNA/RNA helicase
MNCDYALVVQLDNGEASPNINITTNNDGVNNDFHTQQIPVNVSNRNSLLFSRIPCHLKKIIHVCSEHKKPRKLIHVLQTTRNQEHGPNTVRNGRKGIIFSSKIEKLEYSCKLLRRERCFTLHGQLPNTIQQKHLHSFASAGRMHEGEMPLTLLLATVVEASGIDISGIEFVIQYDFPGNLEQYVHRCGRAGRSSTGATGEFAASDSVSRSKEFAVYSFFTRNLQSMAGDLVRLLETHGAWVDPNLRALVQSTVSAIAGKNSNGEDVTRHVSDSNTTTSKQVKKDMESTMDSDSSAISEDKFADLSANRIVLKRACYVSDASSSDDSSCQTEDRSK